MQKISLLNPVVSGFRWAFFDTADLSPALSLAMTLVFLRVCLAPVAWIFRSGYRIKS